MTASPATILLLEKAAADNGFDLALQPEGDWLVFESSHASLRVWLSLAPAGTPVLAVSRPDVAAELGVPVASAMPPPTGAVSVHATADINSTHSLVRRAFQLAQSLPNGLLERFRARTVALPRSTEAERLIVQRVGQDMFRAALVDYWQGRCAVTGLAVPELLRASHIKPWAVSTDEERLDLYNGLLLSPNLDAAFDRGFITFDDTGKLAVSPALAPADRQVLGLAGDACVRRLTKRHIAFLPHHRKVVFRG